jgi:hypothetical protein
MDKFKKYLSEARIKTFEILEPEKPIELYFFNVALCESFYSSIHFLEIILRNRISKAVMKVTGSDWVELERINFFDDAELKNLHNAKENLVKTQKNLNSDNMIAELNFGFWLSLFHRKYEAKIWQKKGALQMVFSNHINTGLVLNIKKIRADLENIRKLRNRIFHHEPIINIAPCTQTLHNLIYFYLESMAPEIVKEIRKVDNFRRTND